MDAVLNLSDRVLTEDELYVLDLGLNFQPVLATPPVMDIIAATEVLADKLSVSHGQESAAQLMGGMVEVLQSFRQQTYKVRKSNLSRSHWRAIKSLRADSSIKILPADKGNKTVVMNADDYLSKLEQRVQAGSNVAIARNPTKSRESGAVEVFKASEPSVPWLYGMPKVHKKDCPVREISSAVGSSGHDLAAALSKLLMPMVGKTRTYVRDG
ncbi:unnamed protein product [Heterosigma akashiwo]